MKKIDFMILLSLFIFFLSGIFLFLYYFNHVKNECLADPFVYGAKQVEESIGQEFIGIGYIITEIGQFPSVIFNSSDSSWDFS